MVALPDSLFTRALNVGKEDRHILERQKEDKEMAEEWMCLYQCEEKDGALYRKEALVVMGGKEIHQALL